MGLGGSKDSTAPVNDSTIDVESATTPSSLNGKSSSQTPDRRKSKTNTPPSKRKHEEISKPTNNDRRTSTRSSLPSSATSVDASPNNTKKVKRESNINPTSTPPEEVVPSAPTEAATSDIVITFSGFKNSSDRFSKTFKKDLTQIATTFGVKIAGEQAADIDTLTDDVTHVIAPPFARTMKVLQALATGKRIMSTKWITDGNCSLEDQDSYGVQRLDKPLKKKNIYLAESFTATNDSSSLTYKHCHLLVGYGEGVITDNMDDADFCIVGSALDESEEALNKVQEEKEKIVQDYPYLLAFEWAEFVDLIYPFYLEQALRKMEK